MPTFPRVLPALIFLSISSLIEASFIVDSISQTPLTCVPLLLQWQGGLGTYGCDTAPLFPLSVQARGISCA
ncbi:unnamed protein product [Mycena citricolor]|uniref:Secreted protein n=1 Tax=Mycena citricolor TaxID=2018698 RepID=A0AAD2GTG7_9AGAR|nr:unnamed protein product [Mycena citricolor]CAK5261962.1 unnamed protein product [Mycena citricolor]CAK5274658.1 unnamed protein product [Mycena citricolor]